MLRDCHAAFGTETALPTMRLLQRLRADPEAPWADYGPRSEGLTTRRLGALLREYGISSEIIRFAHDRARGYRRDGFDDAWRRYTPELLTDSHKQGRSGPETALSLGTRAVG